MFSTALLEAYYTHICTRAHTQEIMEQKRQRQLKKQELGKRRSAASQNRMRIISQLAEDATGNTVTSSDRLLLQHTTNVSYVCSCREEVIETERGHFWDE